MGAIAEGAANALLWLLLGADMRTLEGLAWVGLAFATCALGMGVTGVVFFTFDK